MRTSLAKISSHVESRSEARAFRSEILSFLAQKDGLIKQAFDSRRTDQYSDYNPRRNLQYYHRSEPFLPKSIATFIKTLFKLKTAVDSIKEDFTGDPDFFDSYARVLSCALDRTLRIDQKDMDFAQPQMDYLKELLYLRYRLKEDDIEKLGEKELRNIILDRDEKLLHKQIYAAYNNGGMKKGDLLLQSQAAINKSGPDNLIDKLFGDVKANQENKEVSRSVTITINDKIVDDKEIKKESSDKKQEGS